MKDIIDDYTGSIGFSPLNSESNSRIIVFQDYLLFPHMDVYKNIAFGLKARKKSKTEIHDKVVKYLKYFGLEDKKNVLPNELSSGQKQRVATARAMIIGTLDQREAFYISDNTVTNSNLEVRVSSFENVFNIGDTVSMEIKNYLIRDTLC